MSDDNDSILDDLELLSPYVTDDDFLVSMDSAEEESSDDDDNDDDDDHQLTLKKLCKIKSNKSTAYSTASSSSSSLVPSLKSDDDYDVDMADEMDTDLGTESDSKDSTDGFVQITLEQTLWRDKTNTEENKTQTIVIKKIDEQKIDIFTFPWELRSHIFAVAMVDDEPVNFVTHSGFSRSGAILRTCRQIYKEARVILYGLNHFHFGRSMRTRGHFFDTRWRTVGYKDILRFLRMIGPHNIALIKNVTIRFEDVSRQSAPNLDLFRRKYVNDPVVRSILRRIGTYTCLKTLNCQFAGRAKLRRTDERFIRSLTTVKCETLTTSSGYYANKITPEVVDQLERMMVEPQIQELDQAEEGSNQVKHTTLLRLDTEAKA